MEIASRSWGERKHKQRKWKERFHIKGKQVEWNGTLFSITYSYTRERCFRDGNTTIRHSLPIPKWKARRTCGLLMKRLHRWPWILSKAQNEAALCGTLQHLSLHTFRRRWICWDRLDSESRLPFDWKWLWDQNCWKLGMQMRSISLVLRFDLGTRSRFTFLKKILK